MKSFTSSVKGTPARAGNRSVPCLFHQLVAGFFDRRVGRAEGDNAERGAVHRLDTGSGTYCLAVSNFFLDAPSCLSQTSESSVVACLFIVAGAARKVRRFGWRLPGRCGRGCHRHPYPGSGPNPHCSFFKIFFPQEFAAIHRLIGVFERLRSSTGSCQSPDRSARTPASAGARQCRRLASQIRSIH